MKLLVMADSHGDAAAVREIVARNIKSVDGFVHLGDGLKEFIEAMETFGCNHYHYIAGNHEDDSYFNYSPDFRIIKADNCSILITHGDRYHNKLDLMGVAHIAAVNGADVALCGHTHVAADETIHGVRVINPGALRYWRDKSPGYAILSVSDDVDVEFIEVECLKTSPMEREYIESTNNG